MPASLESSFSTSSTGEDFPLLRVARAGAAACVFLRGPLRALPPPVELLPPGSTGNFCSSTDGLKLAASEAGRSISFPEAISSRGDPRSPTSSSSPASCDVDVVGGGGGVSSSVAAEAFFNAIDVRVLRTISGGKHCPATEKLANYAARWPMWQM
uniref:(northern house mosquito) hypothetical protein n=1 Tax=Culex pipiens TaxID=7175 RepID=A0A8D8CNH2_CULPI